MEPSAGRRCGRCGEIKPLADFAWRRKERGQLHNYCRPCHSDYRREHYLANRQKYIDKAQIRANRIGRERVEYLIEYFEAHPCCDCGETDPVVLEFDHIGEKSFTIGASLRSLKWQTILDEIEKCEVVCANCHRRRTNTRGGFLRSALTNGQA